MEIIKLNDKNKTIEEIDLNDKIISKMKYGVIRIVGEDYLREVTWDTYNYLKNLPTDFKGTIEIQELKLTIQANQIAKIEEKEGESVRYKNFTNLPTETVYLDKNFNCLSDIRPKIEREHDLYYIATCHYLVKDGEKQYYVEPEQIKSLMTMVRDDDPDYPHYVKKATRYGRDVREIQKEQEEKNKKRR